MVVVPAPVASVGEGGARIATVGKGGADTPGNAISSVQGILEMGHGACLSCTYVACCMRRLVICGISFQR